MLCPEIQVFGARGRDLVDEQEEVGKEGAVGDQVLGAAQLNSHYGMKERGKGSCDVLEDIVSGTAQGFVASGVAFPFLSG
jgi:hypothetical protein